MPIDEPGAVSEAREVFEAHRIIEVHWVPSDRPWRGCLQCKDRHTCAQLDWAVERFAHYASISLQKR
ncbi:hypothetical protein O7602_25970 [Micromonospora sp. WMMD1128]|uniref:hypothetical protein n=1 Tax=Micromonospora sp. WMMD1128 TaxID=3015150 RepID=UPI00248C495B|nr:hypothetical protein [Micromonospora sp. WMMD1128]WBB73100.1 hypothetical protein O7602_25970 [Micromonospora sp. WMMD1128]